MSPNHENTTSVHSVTKGQEKMEERKPMLARGDSRATGHRPWWKAETGPKQWLSIFLSSLTVFLLSLL